MKGILLGLLMILLAPGLQAQEPDADWEMLLQNSVRVMEGGRATQVDYAALEREAAQLTRYLTSLSRTTESEFESWPRPARLAFLINAYNAWTLDLVMTGYPGIDSIRDLGSLFRSPWQKKFISLLGMTVSLDHIEHELIRAPGVFDEPRIHFAVNCASIGCPALRWEPYTAAKLESQLEDATRLFLSDRSRNRFEDGRLYVSEIFKWYREDFERGWRGTYSVAEFLSLYHKVLGLDVETAAQLREGAIPIRYLDYDWGLNDVTEP
ncbi:MAG: hypothetical protein RLZZ385_501 [Pseudomonadota bacterium]|jgi:hypothetical protein